jgi:beta-lactamase class A
VGTVRRGSNLLSYDVIANWEASEPDLRDAVLVTMNTIGKRLRDLV